MVCNWLIPLREFVFLLGFIYDWVYNSIGANKKWPRHTFFLRYRMASSNKNWTHNTLISKKSVYWKTGIVKLFAIWPLFISPVLWEICWTTTTTTTSTTHKIILEYFDWDHKFKRTKHTRTLKYRHIYLY